MKKRLIPYTAISILIVLMISCGGSQGKTINDNDVPDSGITPHLDEGAARLIATTHLNRVIADGSNSSGWDQNSVLGAGYPIYTPGISAPAYYEFKVTTLNKDTGFILVSLTTSDYTVPESSTEGKPTFERFYEFTGDKSLKIYRYDWFESAAYQETENNDSGKNGLRAIASISKNYEGIQNTDGWDDNAIDELYNRHIQNAKYLAVNKCIPLYTPGRLERFYNDTRLASYYSKAPAAGSPVLKKGEMPYIVSEDVYLKNSFANGWATPRWTQPSYGYSTSGGVTKPNAMGCGPAAWAILYGYWHTFKGKTRLFDGRYLQNKYDPSACFEGNYNSVIYNVMKDIRSLVNTEVWYTTGSRWSGLTWPWNDDTQMGAGRKFAQNKGYPVDYNHSQVGWNITKVFDEVRNDRPVILLIASQKGFADHYVVVEGVHRAYWSNCGAGAPFELGFKVNWGQGSAEERKTIYYYYWGIDKANDWYPIYDYYAINIGNVTPASEISKIGIYGEKVANWETASGLDLIRIAKTDSFGSYISSLFVPTTSSIFYFSFNIDTVFNLSDTIRAGDYFTIVANETNLSSVKRLLTFMDAQNTTISNLNIQAGKSCKITRSDTYAKNDEYYRFYFDGNSITYSPALALTWEIANANPTTDTILCSDIGPDNNLTVLGKSTDGNGRKVFNVRRFNGSSWEDYGNPDSALTYVADSTFSNGVLAVGTDELPVVYISSVVSGKQVGKVMKYNGSAWTQLGGNIYIPSTMPVSYYPLAIDIDSQNRPVIACKAMTDALFMRWTGSSWSQLPAISNMQNVGIPEIQLLIKVDSNDRIYTAYVDWDRIVQVAYYNESSWINISGSSIGNSYSGFISFDIGPDNLPAIAFSQPNPYQVKKWNGSAWTSLGSTVPSISMDSRIQLRVGSDNMPIVTGYTGSKALAACRWNGSEWLDIGQLGLSMTSACRHGLAFDKSNRVYVIMEDTQYKNGSGTIVTAPCQTIYFLR